MNRFSISQLTRFSGVQTHTIRAWEQRYGALNPNRSKGNTRSYDDNQLRRLLNITSLLELDYKISELAMLPDKKLFDLMRKVHEKKIATSVQFYIPQLIAAGMVYDEPAFEKVFCRCLIRFGMKKSYSGIILPLLEQIGFLWSSNDCPPANEHFVSNLIRQKLHAAIDSLPAPADDGETWLLFLPEGELHEIGLLMSNFLLRVNGTKTVYLGAAVPFESLVNCIDATSPEKLLLFWTHREGPENILSYITDIKSKFAGKIYIAGNPKLLSKSNIGGLAEVMDSVGGLESKITKSLKN